MEFDNDKLTGIIENGTRVRGKVIRLAKSKGFGFLGTEDIPFTLIFFHWSALHPMRAKNFNYLEVGDQLEFEVEETEEKGLRALKITSVEQ